jgi:N-acetylmuramoyl-L-alanine amidase
LVRLARTTLLAILPGLCAALFAAPAQADFDHTVAPGETLSWIAAVDGVSPEALAAANGLSTDSWLTAGETIVIPSGGAASAGESTASGGGGGGGGGYVVQPGDTLSGVAASTGVSVDELAHVNGLYVDDVLPAGIGLTIPGAGSGSSPADLPIPTNETVSARDVGDIAASENVSPSLADAVGLQESGFDNSRVSSANARGVMQIIPSTWDFIAGSLATDPLDPASARDNVRAGVLYLGYLADHTGNDPVSTAASYYQGLGSVQQGGLLPETENYVNSVLSLRDGFRGR